MLVERGNLFKFCHVVKAYLRREPRRVALARGLSFFGHAISFLEYPKCITISTGSASEKKTRRVAGS